MNAIYLQFCTVELNPGEGALTWRDSMCFPPAVSTSLMLDTQRHVSQMAGLVAGGEMASAKLSAKLPFVMIHSLSPLVLMMN